MKRRHALSALLLLTGMLRVTLESTPASGRFTAVPRADGDLDVDLNRRREW